jgi:Zn finger protein HypA/HybF involved in hydrogenase expression
MFIFIGIIVALGAYVYMHYRRDTSEVVDCPLCGQTFRLERGSANCPKCRVRVTRTKDGRLVAH